MQTQSHFLMTAIVNRVLKKHTTHQVQSIPFLIGSFAPDIVLMILTIAYIMQRQATTPREMFGPEFDTLYFTNPVWIIGHNLLHAPLMILTYASIGAWFGLRQGRQWSKWLFWFALGCGFHSLVDILTHHNDGPLVFFPFDWQTRFQ
jgi:hypothetical protein